MEIPEYSDVIADLRRARGLTQAELAGLAGVSRSTVAGIEAGRDARYSSVARVLACLGMELRIAPTYGRPQPRGVVDGLPRELAEMFEREREMVYGRRG